MMYHGMVGEMTRLLSCSYEKGQLFIRTPPFHDALHRVGTREPCYFVITTPPFHDASHRVGSREPCCFTIKKLTKKLVFEMVPAVGLEPTHPCG